MCKEQRSQMEMSTPGTPTSVHLQCYTVNLQMREFSRHGTIHNHQHGGRESLRWTMAHQRGGKNPPQMSTNERVAGSTGGIMKIQAREDKNSSMHPVADPQNVSGFTYAREQATIKEQSQNRQSAALLPKKKIYFPLKITLFLQRSMQQLDTNCRWWLISIYDEETIVVKNT